MPFRSSAQARYMYARHPQIARRWTEEMRGKRGYAKEHPIKAAALPRHVEKSIVGGLLRRAPKEPGPILRSGITRMGRVGVEFEHKGVKGWGVNEEAARTAWQQNHASRYASGTTVGKRDSDSPVQRYEPILRKTTKKERQQERRANKIAGGLVGGVTGLGLGAVAGDLHYPARNHGRYAAIGTVAGTGLGVLGGHYAPRSEYTMDIDRERVHKGLVRQGVKPLLARRLPLAATAARPVRTNPGAVIGKGFGNEALKMVKTGREVASSGWKAGRTGAKPRMSLGAAKAVTSSSAMRGIGQAAQAAGQRPVITGLVGGGILGGLADHEVTKAYGDPEDARYYRLGAGSAALGAGGLAAIGQGGRRVRRDTKELRELRRVAPGRAPKFQRGSWKGSNGKIRVAKPQERLGEEMAHDVRTKNWLARAQRLEQAKTHARSGVIVHGRPAALVGGGLAALGGAEALRRRASERRWN